MKTEFAFEQGDIVKSKKNGLIASATHCAVSAEGTVYLQRGTFAEQWAAEDDLEKIRTPNSGRDAVTAGGQENQKGEIKELPGALGPDPGLTGDPADFPGLPDHQPNIRGRCPI